MSAQRAWNQTDLYNAYHWFKYELGKIIDPPVHLPKSFGYDAPFNPMDNYDASVRMNNLRTLIEIHQDDATYFQDAYAAAVANYEAAHPHRDGQGYGGSISYPPRKTTYYYEISGSGLGFYYEGTLAPYGGSIIKNLFNKVKNIVGKYIIKQKILSLNLKLSSSFWFR